MHTHTHKAEKSDSSKFTRLSTWSLEKVTRFIVGYMMRRLRVESRKLILWPEAQRSKEIQSRNSLGWLGSAVVNRVFSVPEVYLCQATKLTSWLILSKNVCLPNSRYQLCSHHCYEIWPKLSDKLLFCKTRREGTVLNRLYTGRFYLTHSFIKNNNNNKHTRTSRLCCM